MFCLHVNVNGLFLSGGLFDDDSKDSELAFRFGVQAINNQRNKQTDGFLEAGEMF
jgi:hypothetical protein